MLKYNTNAGPTKHMTTSNCKWHHRNKLLTDYHNTEWGYPCTNDQALFQKISLEIMQAGLSWRTVLEKKYDICQCFEHFNLKKVASLNADSIEKILSNPKVIRNRKKIQAIIHNANITLKIQQQHGSFSQFLWEHQPKKQNKPFCSPPREAAQLTQSLRQYGWQFIGTTTCYAFMQAAGIINDHDLTCPIRTIIQQKLTKTFTHNPQKTPGLNPINPQANHIDSKKS